MKTYLLYNTWTTKIKNVCREQYSTFFFYILITIGARIVPLLYCVNHIEFCADHIEFCADRIVYRASIIVENALRSDMSTVEKEYSNGTMIYIVLKRSFGDKKYIY